MYTKLSCLVIFLFSIARASAQTFQIETIQTRTDTMLLSAVPHHQQYFCLTADHKLLIIDSTDKFRGKPIPVNEKIHTLFPMRDSLLALSGWDEVYFYNGNNFIYLRKENIRPPVYTDQQYTVTGSCSGEWGGSVYFTDNRSGAKYECAATCPLVVNNIDGNYIVTATLSHLIGFTTILQIIDPAQLSIYNRNHFKKRKKRYVGDAESKTTKGAEVLVEAHGTTTLASFLYQDELYHIVSNQEETYIAKITDKKFIPVQQLADIRFSSPKSVTNYGQAGILSIFNGYYTSGFIRIKGNSVKVYMFTNRKVE